MATAIIRTPEAIDRLCTRLSVLKLPMTVSWSQGAPRTGAQNRLAQRWYADIARQLGDQTHAEVRAQCKLDFGVPILSSNDPAFDQSFAATFGGLPYEARLKAVEIFDQPVTRLMKLPQMTEYMETMQRHWSGLGIRLTDPDALKYEEEMRS